MRTRPSADRPSRESRFVLRMVQVRAVERVSVEKNRHRLIERDSVFRRIGCSLPPVPLEHLFSIYVMSDAAGPGNLFLAPRAEGGSGVELQTVIPISEMFRNGVC